MKAMHKLLAMVLALTLVLAMATTASAGSITITGTATTEYFVYKICDVEDAVGGYKYILVEEWQNFKAPGFFTVNENFFVTWNKNTTNATDGAAVAQLAREYLEDYNESNPETPITSLRKVSTTKPAEDLGNGYYLLVPNDTTACGVVTIATNKNATITVKTEEKEFPSVTKMVQEDSTQTFGKANDADIGQDVLFHSTITSGSFASNYVLHDDMDECFTFNSDSVSITRGGNTVPASNYTVEINPECDDGCTFHVDFDESFCNSLTKGATLVVSYTAKLNEGAAVDTEHTNTTWLTHTTNIQTERDSTVTKTYKITVKKEDQAGNPLPGAVFVLKDNVGEFYHWNENTKAVEWVESIDEATKYETKTNSNDEDNCVITFYGVDAEVMTLLETVVPDGYTGQTDITVNTKLVNEDGTQSKFVTVTNNLGTALPETGGMGTTLFYVVGGLLAAAAVVLMLTKKRVSAK